MGYELVSDSFSPDTRGRNDNPAPHFTYTSIFEKHFPYYLSIGMTYDQYWNEDCLLVKAYREAEKIREERKNAELWLQGRYIYEALGDISPILHAFAKQGTKAIPYLKEPFPITEMALERKREREEKERYEKIKAKMSAFANKKKGG